MRALKKVLNIFKNILLKHTSNKANPEQEMKPLSDVILKVQRISKLITSRTADSNVPEVQTELMDSLF